MAIQKVEMDLYPIGVIHLVAMPTTVSLSGQIVL